MQGMFGTPLSIPASAGHETTSKTGGRTNSKVAPRLSAKGLKRGFDFSAVLIGLLLFLPLLLIVAGLVLLAQGRPIFIRHNRIGRGGQTFGCLKFRTMIVGADEVLRTYLSVNSEARAEWQATHKLKNDPRITPLGHVMRKLSLDEIPQLINVLRGDMSLVGPRPIVADEVAHYGTSIQHYCSVRPGVTGAWQIGGRNDVSYPRRVEMDTDYVTNWSFAKDISILARTIPAVVRATGY